MELPVRFPFSGGGELFPAGVAGPVAVAVRLQVGPQVLAAGRAEATEAAGGVSVLGVVVHVPQQKAFFAKRLAAHPASMRLADDTSWPVVGRGAGGAIAVRRTGLNLCKEGHQ